MEPEYGFKQKGPEPTRYGDWENKGKCVDFWMIIFKFTFLESSLPVCQNFRIINFNYNLYKTTALKSMKNSLAADLEGILSCLK